MDDIRTMGTVEFNTLDTLEKFQDFVGTLQLTSQLFPLQVGVKSHGFKVEVKLMHFVNSGSTPLDL